MNNIYADSFQQYEYKQKYTSKRKHVSKGVPKDTSKETYDKAKDKDSRVKNDYKTQRNAKRMDWEMN
jgi:hypothetical protein